MGRVAAMRRLATAAALIALAVVGLACGEEEGPKREGLATELGGLQYNVFITRQLNLRDAEDASYFKGPDAEKGGTYYGVFLRACNEGDEPAQAASSFKIVDTIGDEFEPVSQPAGNPFAYRARMLGPQECIPDPASPAAFAPTGGALLVFRLPVSAGENRPLELEIEGPSGTAVVGGEHKIAFELDI